MSREAFYATLGEVETYHQKRTFLLDPMNPIRQAMHDALWQAMREKHPNSTRPSNILTISKEVLGPDRMAEVISPYETNLNMQLKKLTGLINQKNEELKTLAASIPVMKGTIHDPWRTLYTVEVSGENNVTRARILAYNASLLATVHKVPERVYADGNKAFHTMVHVHSALDLEILKRKSPLTFQQWLCACLNRGLKPNLLNPEITPNFELNTRITEVPSVR